MKTLIYNFDTERIGVFVAESLKQCLTPLVHRPPGLTEDAWRELAFEVINLLRAVDAPLPNLCCSFIKEGAEGHSHDCVNATVDDVRNALSAQETTLKHCLDFIHAHHCKNWDPMVGPCGRCEHCCTTAHAKCAHEWAQGEAIYEAGCATPVARSMVCRKCRHVEWKTLTRTQPPEPKARFDTLDDRRAKITEEIDEAQLKEWEATVHGGKEPKAVDVRFNRLDEQARETARKLVPDEFRKAVDANLSLIRGDKPICDEPRPYPENDVWNCRNCGFKKSLFSLGQTKRTRKMEEYIAAHDAFYQENSQ